MTFVLCFASVMKRFESALGVGGRDAVRPKEVLNPELDSDLRLETV